MEHLTKEKLARINGLMKELHSLCALVDKIELHLNPSIKETADLTKLFKELTDGLEVAHELSVALNVTALALHIELESRKAIIV